MKNKIKYLYEIEYLNANPGEARYYRGSRVTTVEPQNDLLINYFTSSSLVKDIIEKEGSKSFSIRQVIELDPLANELYEEHFCLCLILQQTLQFHVHNGILHYVHLLHQLLQW